MPEREERKRSRGERLAIMNTWRGGGREMGEKGQRRKRVREQEFNGISLIRYFYIAS